MNSLLDSLGISSLLSQLEAWGVPREISRALFIILASLVVAKLVDWIIQSFVFRLTAKTRSDVDDRIMALLHRPIFITTLLVGLNYSLKEILPPRNGTWFHTNLLETLAILIWMFVLMRVGSLVLSEMARQTRRFDVIQPSTVPIFDFGVKVVMISLGAYFLIMAWQWDPTPLLTSAGIIGITLGFAARDTIANFFAGVFILADRPYKIGDYIVLDSGERGQVSRIGLRSTRIMTRDDIEIIIPNAVIAEAKIVNQSGGPEIKFRIRVPVGVAYGSDLKKVRSILMNIAVTDHEVSTSPEPRVRFRNFGDSSLDFQLLCWIDDPEWRGRVVDRLLSRVDSEFAAQGIEIPFPKRDVYLKREDSEEDA